jgi:hypothetical protein
MFVNSVSGAGTSEPEAVCHMLRKRTNTEVMLYIYPVDPNLFDTRGQIRF